MNNKKIKKSNIGSTDMVKTMFISKVAIVISLLVLQVFFLVYIYGIMEKYIFFWRTGSTAITAVIVCYLINKQDNPAYKLAWVVFVMAFPVAGGLTYVLLAGNRTRLKFIEEALECYNDTFQHFSSDKEIQKEINEISKSASVQSTYISKSAGFPAYRNTSVKYFPLGEDNFKSLLEELNNAKHFIFMEYFIIKQGEMWNEVLNVLIKKAKQGVDVRLIYDDIGCAMWLPSRFVKEMKSYGIRAVPFNPVSAALSLRQNNRDHRKITVIDGFVGFTGGINLADEYINKNSKFGHWKDTGVMLKGEAVWNLTVMFLQTWKMLTNDQDDYHLYTPTRYKKKLFYSDGYIQPYGDAPVDNEIVGENIYLNMINKAKRYIYITTPYLIIDNEMITALTVAAKSGIDVRIITPGIPDKKTVYMVTQSYYYQLIQAGVRIYQYTPGFIHAKTVVMDDSVATVGTVNFDFRSLYLHFECGVWMFNSSTIYEIKEDYNKTLELCDEVTLEEIEKTSNFKKFGQSLLRFVAPLL